VNDSPDKGTRHEPAHYEDYGFAGVVAHRRLAVADPTFRFLGWEGTDDGSSILTGAPTRTVTRGKTKGRLRYSGQKSVVVVTRAEEDAARRDYELTTGYCSDCVGSGRVFRKWNHLTGSTYCDCGKCHGTGKIP
jgi:hypothetical protein